MDSNCLVLKHALGTPVEYAMIVNGYAILDGFLAVLRLTLGLSVVYFALAVFRVRRAADAPHVQAREERGTLLFLASCTLIALSVASWPVLYLLLQSYVPAWEGVMCIYGVTQIGKGSIGLARFLPDLLTALQLMKPALVFACGCWLVLHLLNKQSSTGPLAGRVVLLLVLLGALATADALIEISYIVIPKKEEFASGGCCTQVFDNAERWARLVPQSWIANDQRRWLFGLYGAMNGALALSLFGALRLRWTGKLLFVPAILTLASIGFNALFLVEAAAPLLLHLPYHHCPYDLLPLVPESTIAGGLFGLGAFGVGWACTASLLGKHEETIALVPVYVRTLLKIGLFGCLGSLIMMSLELALAWAEQH
jgi:hypothetical protein